MKHSHWTYKPTEPSWGPHVSVYNWICIYTHVYIYIRVERERDQGGDTAKIWNGR